MGEWNGFVYDSVAYPSRTLLSLYFHVSHAEGEDFNATGTEYDDEDFTVSGTCSTDDAGCINVKFTINYEIDHPRYYTGQLVDKYTIVGTRGVSEDWQPDNFVFKRTPADILCYRPPHTVLSLQAWSDEEDQKRRYRALWRYAINATIHDVRRRWMTWSYLVDRRDKRKQYIKYESHRYGRNLPENIVDGVRLHWLVSDRDARFYTAIANRDVRVVPNQCVHVLNDEYYRMALTWTPARIVTAARKGAGTLSVVGDSSASTASRTQISGTRTSPTVTILHAMPPPQL